MKENVERLQTRINLVREESRTISYRIEALEERRKELQEQKKHLKELLSRYVLGSVSSVQV
jgi:prefoldin subunit 5